MSTVAQERQPSAIATVLAGYTLAFLLGVPLGSVVGDALGWRAAFWFASGISILGICPDRHWGAARDRRARRGRDEFPGGAWRRERSADVAHSGLLHRNLLHGELHRTGHYRNSGIKGGAIGAVQVATGVGSLIGLPIGARLARLEPPRRA